MKSGNIRSFAWSSEVRAERELSKNLNIVALPFFIYHVINLVANTIKLIKGANVLKYRQVETEQAFYFATCL